jgi:hypothetical protein
MSGMQTAPRATGEPPPSRSRTAVVAASIGSHRLGVIPGVIPGGPRACGPEANLCRTNKAYCQRSQAQPTMPACPRFPQSRGVILQPDQRGSGGSAPGIAPPNASRLSAANGAGGLSKILKSRGLRCCRDSLAPLRWPNRSGPVVTSSDLPPLRCRPLAGICCG